MSPRQIKVKLGNAEIQLPLYQDEKTSKQIAQRVTERLKRIEEESDRIDTHAFALRAAFEFAAEAHAIQQEADDDTREIGVALDAIATRLKEIVAEFEAGT